MTGHQRSLRLAGACACQRALVGDVRVEAGVPLEMRVCETAVRLAPRRVAAARGDFLQPRCDLEELSVGEVGDLTIIALWWPPRPSVMAIRRELPRRQPRSHLPYRIRRGVLVSCWLAGMRF